MRIRRRSLLGLFFVGAATVSLAATFGRWWPQLPSADQAVGEDLFHWLVLRDLSKEPRSTRDALLRQLGTELDAGVEFERVDGSLHDDQREQFQANVDVLLFDWLAMLSREYSRTPTSKQGAFVDSLIERVEKWGVLDYLAGAHGGAGEQLASARWHVLQEIDARNQRWVAKAEQHEQELIGRFLIRVRQRIVARVFVPFGR